MAGSLGAKRANPSDHVVQDCCFLEGGTEDRGVYVVETFFDVEVEGGELETRALKSPDSVHQWKSSVKLREGGKGAALVVRCQLQ